MLPERRPPTHVLTIEIPLNLDNGIGNFDPVEDAVRICLGLARAAYVGVICDDPQVSWREVSPPV
jgi:methylaspartate ammonia-lyase